MSSKTTIPSWGNGNPAPPIPTILLSQTSNPDGSAVTKMDSTFNLSINSTGGNFFCHNAGIGNNNLNLFPANSPHPSPRKRTRMKMEEAFRVLSIEPEHEISVPSRKRQETFDHSYANIPEYSIKEPISPLSCVSPTKGGSMVEDDIDDESSEGTTTTNNTTYGKAAVKEVMYSLAFGNKRPISSYGNTSLAPLYHIDAKIESMIRKSRLQALVMTGKPQLCNGNHCSETFSSREAVVQDDFNVNISSDTMITNQDCDMSGINGQHTTRRRSKSFDDLDVSML